VLRTTGCSQVKCSSRTQRSAPTTREGLGARLADFALTDVRDAGLKVVPECPYTAMYLRRHLESDHIADRPRQHATSPTGQPGQ
jgi:predicted GNAT family acetyltransferase